MLAAVVAPVATLRQPGHSCISLIIADFGSPKYWDHEIICKSALFVSGIFKVRTRRTMFGAASVEQVDRSAANALLQL
jgi:hypothetical protein